MKKIFYSLILILIASAGSFGQGFTISGNLEGQADGMVYIKQRSAASAAGIVTLDSAKSEGGKFMLKGKVDFPDQCYVILGARKQFPLFVENTAITISGKADDLKNIVITGSASQDEMKKLDQVMATLSSTMNQVYGKYNEAKKANNAAESAKLEKQLDSIDNVMAAQQKDFIVKNPNSFVSPVVLQRIQYGMEGEEIDGYLKKFSPQVMKSAAATGLAERVAVLQAVAVGKKAPEFSQADSTGNAIKLSDIYGAHKYTLIDFWASWCGPCRGENPNVVAVWKDYNAKGFHVMGVSYDTDKAKWLKAVVTDQLTWTQVSDLKGWSNATAKIYGINSIPANLLLDKNGTIIAKNLRGEKLREKMAELLK